MLADRLLTLMEIELTALEDEHPAASESVEGEVLDPASATKRAKERIDLVATMARTAEKLLELKRLETAAEAPDAEADEAEERRLRDDLMTKLRALDGRRVGGPRLFDPATGAYRGDRQPLPEAVDGRSAVMGEGAAA